MSSETSANLEQWNARRRLAVELRVAGRSLPDIRRETGLSAPTVIAAHKAYLDGGWAAVPVKGRGRQHGVGRILDAAQEHAVHTALLQAPESVGLGAGVWTLANTAQWIQTRFGLQMEDRTLSRYLARWGLALAPWRQAAHANPQGSAWWADVLPALVKEARSSGAQVVWCCATPVGADGAGILLRAQTLKGRIAWRCLPGTLDAATLSQCLSQLADTLEAPLCVALNAPQWVGPASSAETPSRVAVWACPIGADAAQDSPTSTQQAPAPAPARAPLSPPPVSIPTETSVAMNNNKLTH